MLTPDYLTANQSEKYARAGHALLLEHHKTPHYPLQSGTHRLEGISPLWPPLLGKAIKLFLSTSPKTLPPRFNLAPSFGNTRTTLEAALTTHMLQVRKLREVTPGTQGHTAKRWQS